MILLKRFVKLYFLIVIVDFMIFGMSFIYHFHYTFIFTLYMILLFLLFRSKLRNLHFNDLSITYKKKTILFTDINSVLFTKLINLGNVTINKPFKKNSIALSNLPWESFIQLKELIIQKVESSKIKTRNMVYMQLFYPCIITLLFIISLFLGYNIPSIEFNQNLLISQNINTNHFSFGIDELKFETNISDSLHYVLTEKGLVYYREYKFKDVNLKKTYELPYVNKIDYWYNNDIGALKRFLKFSLIKRYKPILFESNDFKGVLISANINTKLLDLKKKGDDFYLRISFNKQYSNEDILMVLETVSFH